MHVETGGKPHRRRGALNPINPVQEFPTTNSRKGTPLIYLQDRLSGKRFLVDSGATLSLFPHKSHLPPTTNSLSAANGSSIPTWGSCTMPLRFGEHNYTWTFILADVDRPILGFDFLRDNHLIVDAAAHQVFLAGTLEALVQPIPHLRSELYAAFVHTEPAYRDLLAEFQDIFTASPGRVPPLHGVEHEIHTTGPPVYAKARRLDPDKLSVAKAEFDKMEAAGIVRRSDSPWASPLHMVPKPDGSVRPCGDYRRLNNVTRPDRYPVPNMQDFTAGLSGAKVFTKIDLIKGYYQVPVSKDDIPKTAVITPFGLYEFLGMPFGLRNAGNTFQRLMDRVGQGLNFIFIYLDDILIASKDKVSHLIHLRTVFERLRSFGLLINPSKCVFGVSEVEFLGHRVTTAGVEPLVRHVEVIQQFQAPQDIPQLQRFLGMINFYRRFLPGIARTLKPLTDALKGKPKHLTWDTERNTAFNKAKSALSSACSLAHPDTSAEVSLAVDASNTHIGGVLQQLVNSAWAPLAFFSRKLNPAQEKYSAFDRELLACYLSVRHFRFLIEGKPFQLHTDHKPLTHALHRVTPPWSARQQRQLSYIAEFTGDIRHIPGIENPVADALSRPTPPKPETIAAALPPLLQLNPPPPGVDFSALAKLQSACPDISTMLTSTVLKIQYVIYDGSSLLCDLSTGRPRPLVPIPLRRQIFSSLHKIGHPGGKATKRLLSARFCWPHMARDTVLWAKECLDCQRGKIIRHAKAEVLTIPVPSKMFSHLHLDLVGPLTPSNGHTYLLTVIDRTTRWPEAIPLSGISASECAEALFSGWISRFGVPSVITTDRGAQFTGAVWTALCNRLGIRRSLTTSFHPQSNGLVERFHRQLKDSLRARLAGADWFYHLPFVLLALRVAPKENSAISSAELLYGTTLTLPGDFLEAAEPPAENFLHQLRSDLQLRPVLQPVHNSPPKHSVPPDLHKAEFVFIRKDGHKPPLAQLYEGPYKVLLKTSKTFTIALGDSHDIVSIDRLKPCFSSTPVTPAEPPRRGRPPRQEARPPQENQFPAPVEPTDRPPPIQIISRYNYT